MSLIPLTLSYAGLGFGVIRIGRLTSDLPDCVTGITLTVCLANFANFLLSAYLDDSRALQIATYLNGIIICVSFTFVLPYVALTHYAVSGHTLPTRIWRLAAIGILNVSYTLLANALQYKNKYLVLLDPQTLLLIGSLFSTSMMTHLLVTNVLKAMHIYNRKSDEESKCIRDSALLIRTRLSPLEEHSATYRNRNDADVTLDMGFMRSEMAAVGAVSDLYRRPVRQPRLLKALSLVYHVINLAFFGYSIMVRTQNLIHDSDSHRLLRLTLPVEYFRPCLTAGYLFYSCVNLLWNTQHHARRITASRKLDVIETRIMRRSVANTYELRSIYLFSYLLCPCSLYVMHTIGRDFGSPEISLALGLNGDGISRFHTNLVFLLTALGTVVYSATS